jgi:transcriptional regulator GlxA family with amidase domain
MKFCVFLYEGMEPIDLATFGVLSMAKRIEPSIEISTVAPEPGPVTLANGLKVLADCGFANAPECEVLIVGGGPGWVTQAENPGTLDYLRRIAAKHQVVSVCTGAMILAAAGILDGKRATTKQETVPPEIPPLDIMRKRYPAIRSQTASVVDEGSVVTGGGVTLCIDTVLHVLGVRLGDKLAAETARIMEYSRAWKANQAALPVIGPGGMA